MSANAILCAGFVLGTLLGGLAGYLYAWDEANALAYERDRRRAARLERRGRHYRA